MEKLIYPACFYPCENHAYDSRDCRGNGCCKKYGTECRDVCCSRTVESVPAKPEDKNSQGCNDQIVTGKCVDLRYFSVFISVKFSDSGTEHPCSDKSADSADHMNTVRSGIIVESPLGQKTAAPRPMCFNRINYRGDDCRI